MQRLKKKVPQKNEKLRRARLARNWTQSRLAELLGCSVDAVRSWEGGYREPLLDARERLCSLFGMTVEELGLDGYSAPSSIVQTLVLDSAPVMEGEGEGGSDTAHLGGPTDSARQKTLRRVRSVWIEGILERSLYHEILIVLGLREQPDAVSNPWRLAVQESNLPARRLSVGTGIVEVFDRASGSLLLLGEPGAGKTTLLLQLAHALIKRAMQDESYPLPVIFNLSSWAQRRESLDVWFAHELYVKYGVPLRLAQSWVSDEKILPLLDGLDEVAESFLPGCVEAINSYRKEHGLLSMVVCSRSSNYLGQTARLALHTSVVVQPLSQEQIQDYIASGGEELALLRVALENDPDLRELATSPLMLSILTLIVVDHPRWTEDLLIGGSLEERRKLIFQQYVNRVLLQRGKQPHYDPEQTKRWLAWLAFEMQRRGQSEFYVERIQPDWLPNISYHQRYRRVIVWVVFGLQVMFSVALFAWLRGGKHGNVYGVGVGLLGLLGSGSGNSILGWMAPGLGGGLEGGGALGLILGLIYMLVTLLVDVSPLPAPSRGLVWHMVGRGVSSGLVVGSVVGIFGGIVFGVSGGVINGVYRGAGVGLFSAVLFGVMIGLITGLQYERDIHQEEKLDRVFSRSLLDRIWYRLWNFLYFTACAVFMNGIVYGVLAGEISQNVVVYSLVIGFAYGVAFGMGGATRLILGLGLEIVPAEIVGWSWGQVVRHFGENVWKGLAAGFAIAVSVGGAIGCASAVFYGIGYGLRFGLVFGPIVGLISGVASILTGVLRSGWSSRVLDEHEFFRPNEGIRRSFKNALFAACLFGPVGGLASGIVCGIAFKVLAGVPGWPILGAGFGILSSLLFAFEFLMIHGGIAVLEHYMLRWYLWRAGAMPWNYVAFLNFAVERILLRKLGGGYMFPHRLLLDYFATLVEPGLKQEGTTLTEKEDAGYAIPKR